MTERKDGYLVLIPSFLAGIHSSIGMPRGEIVFGSLAASAILTVVLDRINPLGDDGPSLGMSIFIGLAIGLAGLTIGYGVGSFVDFVRSY